MGHDTQGNKASSNETGRATRTLEDEPQEERQRYVLPWPGADKQTPPIVAVKLSPEERVKVLPDSDLTVT
jgi:hypothetical protein